MASFGRAEHEHDTDNATASPRANYTDMDQHELARARDDELARQEAALGDLQQGAKRLHHQAVAINVEVEEQIEIAADLSHRMDRAQEDVELATAIAREVNAFKAKACKLYVVIVLLAVADVIVHLSTDPK